MNFVWIARETPLIPTLGAYVYSNGIIRGLLSTGARGRLVAYERPGKPAGHAEGLDVSLAPPPKKSRLLSLLTSLPSDAYRLRSTEMERRIIASVTPDVDVVIIDFYPMGWAAQVIRRLRARRRRPLVVVYLSHQYEQTLRRDVARDFVGSPLMRFALWVDGVKAARLERRLLGEVDVVTAIIERDRTRFLSDAPNLTAITLTPGYDAAAVVPERITVQTPRRVILCGQLEWIAKKRNFLRFLDAAEAPFGAAGIELLVVGRTDPGFAKEVLARSRICRFTGEVPDVRPYMAQGRIGVMPDEVGGGFKLKLLDYVFAGLPIAAIRSQVSDLPLDMDRDIIARDNVGALVSAIVEAIDDVPRLAAMAERALDQCTGQFDWSERGRRLAEAITAAAKIHQSGSDSGPAPRL